ncbi:MAG: 50S ribosomal protein L25, partial [Desulfovibrio sp.]|nr:50S ribosomal protein L25 [Desulfovibrio sp.]
AVHDRNFAIVSVLAKSKDDAAEEGEGEAAAE